MRVFANSTVCVLLSFYKSRQTETLYVQDTINKPKHKLTVGNYYCLLQHNLLWMQMIIVHRFLLWRNVLICHQVERRDATWWVIACFTESPTSGFLRHREFKHMNTGAVSLLYVFPDDFSPVCFFCRMSTPENMDFYIIHFYFLQTTQFKYT